MSDLHLLRLAIDPAGLARLARHLRIADEDDAGYRLHALLAGLFGGAAPAPWQRDDRTPARHVVLWAYSSLTWDALATLAHDRFTAPDAVGLDADLISLLRGALAWEACASKPVVPLAQGRTIAFDLRACAVVRLHRDLPGIPATGDHGAIAARKAGNEVDVLIAEALRQQVHPSALPTETIYQTWLASALGRTNGSTVEHLQLTGQRTISGLRRHQAGGRRPIHLPEVRATGTLTITDPVAWAATLARGIGRHRAFGFGMLLLRPVAG